MTHTPDEDERSTSQSDGYKARRLRTALRTAGLDPDDSATLSDLRRAFKDADRDPSRYVVTSGLSDPKKKEIRGSRSDLAISLADRGVDPGYRIQEFRKDLEAMRVGDMPIQKLPNERQCDARATVINLASVAAYWPSAEVAQGKIDLKKKGATVRFAREWKGVVGNTREEREREAEEEGEEETDPSDLNGGEITAWIAEQIEHDHFARGRDGALYYYDGGCYHDGGDRYLKQRIEAILQGEGMKAESTTYRRNEVRAQLEIEAPQLWETPPRDRLCLKNGILNLDTGEFEEHGPEKWLSTRQIPIEHDPEAEGHQWEDFLDRVFPDDGGAELGYELMAYLLLPPKGRRKAVYLTGDTQTGKSTMIDNFVEAVLGDDGAKRWDLQDLEQNKHAAASLLGATLNVSSDLPSRPMKGTSVFKQITGGDKLMGERKYEDPFVFRPTCHLLFSGNGPIVAPDAGKAFWSRWHVIPFTTCVGEDTYHHVDREELDAALQDSEELSALLNEILRVLPRVREHGIEERTPMTDALAKMRGHVENDVPEHAGDGAAAESRPPSGPEPSISTPTPDSGSETGGTPPSKNFEKETDSDTHGPCVRDRRSTKSFERGNVVRLPDGAIGKIVEQAHDDPPIYVVQLEGSLGEEGEERTCPADDLEAAFVDR
jgi:P4 family phage/plasmid primase-like protien